MVVADRVSRHKEAQFLFKDAGLCYSPANFCLIGQISTNIPRHGVYSPNNLIWLDFVI